MIVQRRKVHGTKRVDRTFLGGVTWPKRGENGTQDQMSDDAPWTMVVFGYKYALPVWNEEPWLWNIQAKSVRENTTITGRNQVSAWSSKSFSSWEWSPQHSAQLSYIHQTCWTFLEKPRALSLMCHSTIIVLQGILPRSLGLKRWWRWFSKNKVRNGIIYLCISIRKRPQKKIEFVLMLNSYSNDFTS